MRLVMMGTGPFAVPTFRRLIASPHDVAALVTRPVRSKSKGASNPMRDAAAAQGVNVLEPRSVNTQEARETLVQLAPDLLVVCDFGQILKAEILATAPLGGINLHGSLLPKYRGAAPVNWAIWNGERKTGVSVIHMTPKMDAGPILATRRTEIEDDETAVDLERRLAELGVDAVLEAIRALETWDRQSPLGVAQNVAEATKAPRLEKRHGQVDWAVDAHRIRNQVRALKPWPGTFTHVPRSSGSPLRLILDEVHVVDPQAGDARAGEVVLADEQIVVATGKGHLAIRRLQPAGKRVMTAAEFLRGHRLPEGSRLE